MSSTTPAATKCDSVIDDRPRLDIISDANDDIDTTLSTLHTTMAINSLWFKWKNLKLPWRNSFMVGTCLSTSSVRRDANRPGRL